MCTDTEIRDHVDAGFALLNDSQPGWQSKVDLDDLNIDSTFRCVLGQLYGNYRIGIADLGLENPWRFGFTLSAACCELEYVPCLGALGEEWRHRISEARENA